jgi:hypothetical protein
VLPGESVRFHAYLNGGTPAALQVFLRNDLADLVLDRLENLLCDLDAG